MDIMINIMDNQMVGGIPTRLKNMSQMGFDTAC